MWNMKTLSLSLGFLIALAPAGQASLFDRKLRGQSERENQGEETFMNDGSASYNELLSGLFKDLAASFTPTPQPSRRPTTARPTTARPMTPRPTTARPMTARPTAAPVGGTTSAPTSRPMTTPTPTGAPQSAPTTPAPFSAPTTSPPTALLTVLGIIQSLDRLSTFSSTISAGGASLEDDFSTLDPITAFGPINSAWTQFGLEYLNVLTTNLRFGLQLESLVQNHVHNGTAYLAENFMDGLIIPMLSGEAMNTTVNETGIFLRTFANRLGLTGEVQMIPTNEIGTNGVLHETGVVLSPSWYFLNIIQILTILNARFSILLQLIVQAGLESQIANTIDTTLLAPTNDAFNSLDPTILAFLQNPANNASLVEVLLYNYLPELTNFAIMPIGDNPLETFQGETVTMRIVQESPDNLQVFFNDARSSVFILSKFSIIYQLDKVLFPPVNVPTVSSMTVSAPVPLPTVFAPTIPVPPASALVAAPRSPALSTLLEIFQESYTQFASQVVAAGLGNILRNTSTAVTVFVPSNKDYAAVSQDYINKLATDGYKLHNVLWVANHIAMGGAFLSTGLQNGQVIYLLNDEQLIIKKSGDSISLETKAVSENPSLSPVGLIAVDNVASNGIYHETDSILLPEWYFQGTLEAAASLSNRFEALLKLLFAVNVTDADLHDVTVLAPNNDAFSKLPNATVDYLVDPQNEAVLLEIIQHHLITEVIAFSRLGVGNTSFTTALGDQVVFTITKTDVRNVAIEGQPISEFWLAKTAILYELNEVLIPSSVVIPGDSTQS